MSIGRWRAFPPRTIVEAKQSALGCRAITQVRALTVAGQLYVNYAHDIHWDESKQVAEIYVGREWIALTRLGLESWATEEGLNILNPDNTVTLCADAVDGDTPILGMAPVGGGGGDPEGLMKHVTPGLFKRGDRVYQVLVNPETGDEKNYYGTVDADEIEYRDMVFVKFDDSPAFARTVAPWFLWLVEEDGEA